MTTYKATAFAVGSTLVGALLLLNACNGNDALDGLGGAGGEKNPGSGGRVSTGGQGGAATGAGGLGGQGTGGENENPKTCTPPAEPAENLGGQGGTSFEVSGDREPSLVGTFVDNWDGTHSIDAQTWDMGSIHHIAHIDNAAGFVIAYNDLENTFSPGLWSKISWVKKNGTIYMCQGVYDAPTFGEAYCADLADPMDPETSGCGLAGFSWSVLEPAD